MKPYLLKATLQRKEPELHFEACQVDHVLELSGSEFRFFQHNLMEEYDFLREYNKQYASAPTEGVRNGLLILGRDTDDGILVCTEGYDYARYSAFISNARQILMLKEYPALENYGSKMTAQADTCIQKALTVGLADQYVFSMDAYQGESLHPYFNRDLFLDLIGDRPEVEDIETDGDEIRLTISQEYLPKREQPLRELTEEEFKVACAKHLLWAYGAGGEQADFRNCEFYGTNFANLDLNNALFDGAVFKWCNMHDASLCFASFQGCTFLGCSGHDLTAEEANFRDTIFDHCNLSGAVMTHSDFSNVVFQDCEMDHASMQNSLITGMILRDSASPSLNMFGTTIDEEEWNGQSEESLSQEELQ